MFVCVLFVCVFKFLVVACECFSWCFTCLDSWLVVCLFVDLRNNSHTDWDWSFACCRAKQTNTNLASYCCALAAFNAQTKIPKFCLLRPKLWLKLATSEQIQAKERMRRVSNELSKNSISFRVRVGANCCLPTKAQKSGGLPQALRNQKLYQSKCDFRNFCFFSAELQKD